MSYYVDVFGLAAAAVGTMFLVTKLVDALTDVVMGALADRTRSRWGRFRPYLLFGAVPFGLIGYAMFAGPDLSPGGKLAYAYATYSLMMIAYTAINIPYSSLMGVMTPSSDERTTLSTFRFVFAFGAQLLISGFVLVFAALFTLMNVAVRGGATIFFMKYYVVDGDKAVFWIFDRTSVFFVSGTAAMVAGVATTKLFTRFFDKRTLLIGLTALNALGLAVFFFVPPEQYGLMLLVNVLATFVVGPTPAVVWSMYADCADYGAWKFGRRTTGLVFSGAMFAQKTGLAVGAGLAGWILDAFGFVANQAQTPRVVLGIRLMFSLFPAVLALLAAGAVLFYPLRKADLQKMEVSPTTGT